MAKPKKDTPDSPQKPQIRTYSKNNMLSWIVFIPTLVIVFISLISVVFPALIERTLSPLQDAIYKAHVVDPFQTGILAIPLIIVNVIILAIGIAYYKGSKGKNLFAKIQGFDLSQRKALIALAIILAVFVAATAGQLGTTESWEDYKGIKDRIKSWTISDFGKSFEPHIRLLLLSASVNIFGNIRVIPFLASIVLLALAYFFTTKITQNRFAGIVSTLLILQSGVFLSYDSSATYDNFWILLYLFSLYLVYKKWPASPALYIVSIFGKALTILFLPMSMFFISRSQIPRRSMLYALAAYGGLIILLAGAAVALHVNYAGTAIDFDSNYFMKGFAAMAIQMRFDYVLVLFLLPLTVMLFLASRKGTLHADSIQIFILGILLSAPLLVGFTTQTNQPYRFVSLSVFFAIGVGLLLSRKTRIQAELSSK